MAASSTKRGPIKSTPNEQRSETNQSTPTQIFKKSTPPSNNNKWNIYKGTKSKTIEKNQHKREQLTPNREKKKKTHHIS